MIRAQWREFGKMTTCIQRLQAQLAKSAGVGEEELTLLVDAFAVEAATDVATVALDSKRLEAAAAVVKAHTIDRSGR